LQQLDMSLFFYLASIMRHVEQPHLQLNFSAHLYHLILKALTKCLVPFQNYVTEHNANALFFVFPLLEHLHPREFELTG